MFTTVLIKSFFIFRNVLFIEEDLFCGDKDITQGSRIQTSLYDLIAG